MSSLVEALAAGPLVFQLGLAALLGAAALWSMRGVRPAPRAVGPQRRGEMQPSRWCVASTGPVHSGAAGAATREAWNDEALMVRTAAGEGEALALLYDRYAPAVMGLALRIVGDRGAAEEVVQETFWRVWRSAGSYQPGVGTFTGWMFGIAHHLAIDCWRRRRARPPLFEEELPAYAEPAAPDADVAESAMAAIRRAQVQTAMASLPEEQRRVIELAYFGGLTRQEIAAHTGDPLGTVHTRARLGLLKLREALQAQGLEGA